MHFSYYFIFYVEGAIKQPNLVGLHVIDERLHVLLEVGVDRRPTLHRKIIVVLHQVSLLGEDKLLFLVRYQLIHVAKNCQVGWRRRRSL